MKKRKKILDKVIYEENPWGDDAPVLGKPIKNLFPPGMDFKNAPVHVFDSREDELVNLFPPKDSKILRRRAEEIGLSPNALIIGIMHDYLRGRLVRADK